MTWSMRDVRSRSLLLGIGTFSYRRIHNSIVTRVYWVQLPRAYHAPILLGRQLPCRTIRSAIRFHPALCEQH